MFLVENRPASSTSSSVREIDPLLKDLNEKKQSFRRNVVSLAAELKGVRSRLASQEQSFAKETVTRKVAENKAKQMEEEIFTLQKRLEERNGQLQASTSSAEKYLKELDGIRSQLAATKATAEASAASAQSAQLQCLALVKELDEKNCSLKEHEDRVTWLGEQLDNLQKDLHARESSQKQLKDEVLRIEQDIMETLAKAGPNKNCELMKILDEVSPKNFEKMNKMLTVKDEEIAKLKDEVRIMSAHWNLKAKELESQLEKQRRADQELKKRVLKLEFCLQEARGQTRKLQRRHDFHSILEAGNAVAYMPRVVIPATNKIARMTQQSNGCKVVDLEGDGLTPGGVPSPNIFVLLDAGLLEFRTDGGTPVLAPLAPEDDAGFVTGVTGFVVAGFAVEVGGVGSDDVADDG